MTEKNSTPELSKAVLDASKDSDRFISMMREHAKKVGETVGGVLGEEHGPAAEAIMLALAEHRATHRDALTNADVGLTVELADDAEPRDRRDKFEKRTREAIGQLRQRTVGLYGESILPKLMLAGSTPKDPKQLERYAERAATEIAKMTPSDFPESLIEGGKPSPKKWAASIREPAASLKKALDDVDQEIAEAVTAQSARNKARDAYQSYTPGANALAEGFLRFCQMDDEADRLERPVGSTAGSGTPTEPTDPPANADATAKVPVSG